jgi:hypothetical protein
MNVELNSQAGPTLAAAAGWMSKAESKKTNARIALFDMVACVESIRCDLYSYIFFCSNGFFDF